MAGPGQRVEGGREGGKGVSSGVCTPECSGPLEIT